MVKYSPVSTHEDSRVMGSDYDQSHVWSGLSYSSIFSYESSADQFRSFYTYGSQCDSKDFKKTYGINDNSSKAGTYASNFKLTYSMNALNYNDGAEVKGNWSPIFETLVVLLSYILVILTLPFSLLAIVKRTEAFEQLVVFRLGRTLKMRDSGINIILPCIDSYQIIDTREQSRNITAVQITTEDKAVIELDILLTYSVKDPVKCVSTVQNYDHAVRSMARSNLQKNLVKKYVSSIEKNKKVFEDELRNQLNKSTSTWGLEIGRLELSIFKMIQKPEAPANKVLKTLMQPNFMSAFWDSLTSGAIGFLPPDPGIVLQRKNSNDLDYVTVDHQASTDRFCDLPLLIAKLNAYCDRRSLAEEIDRTFSISCVGLGEFHLNLSRDPSSSNQIRPHSNVDQSDFDRIRSNSSRGPSSSNQIQPYPEINQSYYGSQSFAPHSSQSANGVLNTDSDPDSSHLLSDSSTADRPRQPLAGLGPPALRSDTRLVRVEMMDSADLRDILTGSVDPARLYAQNRLKVQGDISAAKKLKLVAEQARKAGASW